MADEDYGEDDTFFFDDDDYLYVEDDYAIADELAETQVPSPGYAGVNDEIAMESFEYDVYEYFGELEYGSDSYWDAGIKHLDSARAGEKRKSADDAEGEAAVVKKRRKDAGLEPRDNVLFMPFKERLPPLPPKVHGEGGFALLPDWKERFPDCAGEESPLKNKKKMPADMRRAAEAEGEEEEQEEALEGEEGQMELGSDEDEDDEGDEDPAAGIDQDVIMHVLRQRLADSGMGDVDESVFKDAIAQMLSGEGDGDDAVGGLASLLLGQKDGGGKAFQGFLADQGVRMDQAEDHEEHEDGAGIDKDKDEPHGSGSAQNAKSTTSPKTRASASRTSSATATTPNHKTPTTHNKSKRTTASTTTEPTLAKQASPIVVPSPPPVSMKTSRKRSRAPSLDEPALPQPEEAPVNHAKPAAKRRRAPQDDSQENEAEMTPSSSVPAAGKRTTRSAAAAASGKAGR